VRVTAQLIDASTDSHVWAETYDRELADVFAIQSEIAQRITDQLGAHLSAQERTVLAKKPTQNVEAFEHYTRARALMETAPDNFAYEENVTKAVGLLEQAVAKDQQFSLAYSALAEANIQLYRQGGQEPKYLAQANAALQEAHRLAPEAGETHFAQALFHYYGHKDFDRALATLEVAARSLPNNAQVFILRGLLERRLGRWEESLRHFKQAIELDPKDHTGYGNAAGSASALRRYEEAHRILDAAIAAFPTEADGFRAWKGFVALKEGDTAAARRELEKIRKKVDHQSVMLGFYVPFLERNYAEAEEAMNAFANATARPEDFFDFQARLAVATNTMEKRRASLLAALARSTELIAKHPDDYINLRNNALLNAALGNKEEAIRVAKRAVELRPVSQDAFIGPDQLNTLATIYAWTGEKDLAFETLFTLVKLPRGLSYGELKLDPAWDNLRDDPRFGELLAQAAKPFG
jgi:tetratricopeptide (TPR) repeat protein